LFIKSTFSKFIGIIRSKKKKNKLFLSWAVLKKFRNKKYSSALVKEYVNKKNNTFFAEVHKYNIKSIKICENSGFKLLGKKNSFLLYKKNKF
jgi:RimJ/RimL family protein N-acetyltransferase